MEQLDVWTRERPTTLPFAIHVYRDTLASYLVYDLEGVVHSEPIANAVAMSMANQLGMIKRQHVSPAAE